MITLDQFLKQSNPRLPNSAWVEEPGFASFYVRNSSRYVMDRKRRFLDLASMVVEKKGKGTFTALVNRLKKDHNLYVEQVLTEKFAEGLLRMGFTRDGESKNFWMLRGTPRAKKTASIAGQRRGMLEVLGPSNNLDEDGQPLWRCRCLCGNPVEKSRKQLCKNSGSCGCLMKGLSEARRCLSGTHDRAIALRKEGLTSNAIAKKLGISRQRVCQHLQGTGMEHRVLREVRLKDDVVRMHGEGLSRRVIAEKLGTSLAVLAKVLGTSCQEERNQRSLEKAKKRWEGATPSGSRLMVLEVFRRSDGDYRCQCRCSCGEVVERRLANVALLKTRSCGCLLEKHLRRNHNKDKG